MDFDTSTITNLFNGDIEIGGRSIPKIAVIGGGIVVIGGLIYITKGKAGFSGGSIDSFGSGNLSALNPQEQLTPAEGSGSIEGSGGIDIASIQDSIAQAIGDSSSNLESLIASSNQQVYDDLISQIQSVADSVGSQVQQVIPETPLSALPDLSGFDLSNYIPDFSSMFAATPLASLAEQATATLTGKDLASSAPAKPYTGLTVNITGSSKGSDRTTPITRLKDELNKLIGIKPKTETKKNYGSVDKTPFGATGANKFAGAGKTMLTEAKSIITKPQVRTSTLASALGKVKTSAIVAKPKKTSVVSKIASALKPKTYYIAPKTIGETTVKPVIKTTVKTVAPYNPPVVSQPVNYAYYNPNYYGGMFNIRSYTWKKPVVSVVGSKIKSKKTITAD